MNTNISLSHLASGDSQVADTGLLEDIGILKEWLKILERRLHRIYTLTTDGQRVSKLVVNEEDIVGEI